MNEWIIFLALAVTVLSLVTAGCVCACCQRMEQRKNSGILRAVREQDRLARELEHTRIEKETIEKMLVSKLSKSGESDSVP